MNTGMKWDKSRVFILAKFKFIRMTDQMHVLASDQNGKKPEKMEQN